MAETVGNCPRCGTSKMTFDVLSDVYIRTDYNWRSVHEVFCICRHCHRSTTFLMSITKATHKDRLLKPGSISSISGSINDFLEINGYISLRDDGGIDCPEMVPPVIAEVFREGASSFAAGCPNAAGAMFRLCLDLATKDRQSALQANAGAPPNQAQRNRLFDRLAWLFAQNLVPSDLQELADCVRDDGNDGAHDGTLTLTDAEDLLDFTVALLERVYTEPGRLVAARSRRDQRRATSGS